MGKIQLWSEGYACNGQSSGATFHGEFEADDMRGAVKLFKESLTDEYSISCVDIENLNVWGCRFFDNETDAKKSFG